MLATTSSPMTVQGAIGGAARLARPAGLSLKLGRRGAFIGCSNHPNCRYTRALGPDRFTLAEALPLLAAQKAKGKGKTSRTARPARAGPSTNDARAAAPRKSRQGKPPGVKRRHA
jgi:ssDNA-binding Zn-finger/Zn-ribbon topoisomerase 1